MFQSYIFIITAIGTLFISSNYFIDAWTIPKWLLMISGLCLGGFIWSFMNIIGNSKYKSYDKFIIWSIILAIFVQSVYGILQYTHFLSSTNSFRVTGSFDNPAGFAASICAAFPFCLWGYVNSPKRQIRILLIIAITFVITAIILSGSRAGIISLFIVIGVWYWRRIPLRTHVKWLIAISLFIIFIITLYYLKKDSADGRLLIWRCAIPMILEHPLIGYGTGGFEAHYMNYQANFLHLHSDASYSQLADNVQYPFCEYLNIVINYGFIGLFIACTLIFVLTHTYRKRPSKDKKIALLCWISIAVFAIFSYPLMYPFVWMMLLFSAYIILKESIKKRVAYITTDVKKIANIIAICIFIYTNYQIHQRIQAECEWKKAVNLSLLGKNDESFALYQKAQHKMKADRYFIYNYSAELYSAERYKESLTVALQCRKLWANYDLELLLGRLYEQLKQYKKAEQHYKLASFMCPNRFIPLYQMVLLLNKEHRIKESKDLALLIIKKDVKIPSQTIQQIKKEMSDFILNSKHIN